MLLLLLLLMLTSAHPFLAQKSDVLYLGRHFPMSLGQGLSWSGSGASVIVTGTTYVAANVKAPLDGARIHVFVNETLRNASIRLSKHHDGRLVLIRGLRAEFAHRIDMVKATEDGSQSGHDGALLFRHFEIASDRGRFLSPPKPKERRLEFIGDSDTAGFCIDGKVNSKTDNDDLYEDSSLTWAAQLARALNASMNVEAVSGWGVTKYSQPIQPLLPFSDGFGRKHTFQPEISSFPHGVLILIGPNDYTSAEKPPEKYFIQKYTELLEYANRTYGAAAAPPRVIHVCGGSGNGFDPCEAIKKASEEWNKKPSHSVESFYVSISLDTWNRINAGTDAYNGCDGHYNEHGHRVLMNAILPDVRRILKWGESAKYYQLSI